MAYYRVRTGNRESIVEYDQPMSFVGEIYKDRLVGECDEYGNLKDFYISPEATAALEQAAEDFARLYPEYRNTPELKREYIRAMVPPSADKPSEAINPQAEVTPEQCGIYTRKGDDIRSINDAFLREVHAPAYHRLVEQLTQPDHPEECGFTQVLPYIAVMKDVHARVAKPLTATHTLKDLLECLPSSQVRWSDIKPLPEFYPGLKRDLTVEGDVVETPITVEEPVVTKLSPIETILTQATNCIPLRNLTIFGATEAVNYLFDKVGPQGFNALNYSKWIMDHGNSNTYELLEALQTTTPLPLEAAYPITPDECARLIAYIGKINSTLVEHGIDPHYVQPPEVWQSLNVWPEGAPSAFDLIKQNHPELTHEQYLADCLGRGSVVMDPNDTNPLKLDPEKELKVMRSMIISALDIFKDQVDQSYGYYEHLGEARNTLMEKQFKHLRRYAKQLVRRLTAPGDTFDQVFIDTAESDQFGFLTRELGSKEWTRHFTIKFVDDNWLISEH